MDSQLSKGFGRNAAAGSSQTEISRLWTDRLNRWTLLNCHSDLVLLCAALA